MKRKQPEGSDEVTLALPCPMWLQKHMLRNLSTATRNKVDPKKAKKAMKILKNLVLEGENK